ncbi:catechol 1,2-dioxygenase [Tsukamurella sp. 8F]|uniref:catechol 1,2-dioxygenase n=1 Tax=unclassified Tsukamurella TaxID=2633480 RepID=UPI0023B921D0|nr:MULTISPECIES: catechol 1,2-dioxygenase [unclassified Tsukamurella]MDF0528620.1 catechol 1,2-dioxygenase [Tsukamurella sp. 8J]MDF0585582.1 catechol 1,2-dioxygenase [Tsukamurella sp. 8F]
MTATEYEAKAADSGAGATAQFLQKAGAKANTPPERVSELAWEVIHAVHDTIRKHKVTYPEYDALKAWLIQVGADGEWPLFLDVWLEHVVEEVANEHHKGNKGTIEGPYYVPDAPEFGARGTLPMREGEEGTPLTFSGQVRDLGGAPLAGAKVELWQADAAGYYSQFAPDIPEWNLRGSFTADDEGRFSIDTIRPAPYMIPTDGSCGKLIAAAGWHPWRPAHLHLKVSAPGHDLLTAQLYFPGDEHNGDDVAQAVKPELMLAPQPALEGPGEVVVYDFVLDPATEGR